MLKKLKHEQTSYAVRFLEERTAVIYEKTLKVTMMSRKGNKIYIQRFLFKDLKFLRSFHRWNIGTVQLANEWIIQQVFGIRSFTIEKNLKMTPKKNQFWQLFDKLVNF